MTLHWTAPSPYQGEGSERFGAAYLGDGGTETVWGEGRARMLLVMTLLVALWAVLSGCEGSYRARLTMSNIELLPASAAIVQIRALNPPDLKTLQIGPVGMLTFNPTVIQILGITGVNGFTILGSVINNGLGWAQFTASFIGGSIRPILGTPWSIIEIPMIELTVQAVGPAGSDTDITITQIDLCLDRIGRSITLSPGSPGKVVIVAP